MKLMIVESPHKAQLIQKFLGSGWTVKASVGHIRDLPLPKNLTKLEKEKYGDYSIDVSNNFKALYKVSPDKRKIVTELKALLKKANELYLCTDSDAEGAAIAWHLLQELKPTIPTYRATWNEITDKAVRAGLKNAELINESKKEPSDFFNAAESALARAAWDRLYGFKTSPYMWQVLRPGSSSGRVQTPGAKLVVERELKRLKHKTVSYYSITGLFDGTLATLVEVGGKKIASGSHIDDDGNVKDGYQLITDETVDKVLEYLNKREYKVGEVTSKPYRRSAPPPFTTSTALQSIGAKTGMSSKQLTSIFQNLYASEGAITYIRTVSVVAAPEAIKAARDDISRLYGAHYLPKAPKIFKDKKTGNSGHECIRVIVDDKTGKFISRKFTDSKVQRVFDSIYKRMLASQAIDCEGTTWTGTFISVDGKATFSASETEIHEPGWTKIYAPDDDDSDEK